MATRRSTVPPLAPPRSSAQSTDGAGEDALAARTETHELDRGVIQRVNFRWLNALRWAAIVGQTLAIAFVHFWMEVPLPLLPLSLIIFGELCVNFVAIRHGDTRHRISEGETATFVVLDLITFTGLLLFTGGPSNPFSFFYIVHVSMGALFLSQPYAWTLVGLSVASYSALFVWHVPLVQVASSWDVHLHGVWVAYGLGATCVVYFIQRARAEILEREQWLAAEAGLRQEAERLSSLATLAAGAAHELASPLGTIAVVSKELEHELTNTDLRAALDDVRLVRTQVERCRKILTRMAHTAGEAPGELDAWTSLSLLVSEVVDELVDAPRIEVRVEDEVANGELECPPEALGQALRVLLDNALDASAANVRFTLQRAKTGDLEISVSDTGPGMPASVLKRVFDPFFTTKAPGKGMGLGLYLAHNVVTGLGGSLTLDSRPGSGTIAVVTLPKERFRLESKS